jgi:hypothetical protein
MLDFFNIVIYYYSCMVYNIEKIAKEEYQKVHFNYD